MVYNTLSLHWLDKHWQGRGYANHHHLIVDYDNHTYRRLVNFAVPTFGANRIEVKRKSDLDDYERYLKNYDFKETQKEILS